VKAKNSESFAFAFVPFLRLGDKPPGEAARVLAAGEN